MEAQLSLFTAAPVTVVVADTWGTQCGNWHYWRYNARLGVYTAICNSDLHTRTFYKSQQDRPGKVCPVCERMAE